MRWLPLNPFPPFPSPPGSLAPLGPPPPWPTAQPTSSALLHSFVFSVLLVLSAAISVSSMDNHLKTEYGRPLGANNAAPLFYHTDGYALAAWRGDAVTCTPVGLTLQPCMPEAVSSIVVGLAAPDTMPLIRLHFLSRFTRLERCKPLAQAREAYFRVVTVVLTILPIVIIPA